ncbi:multidrug export protein MepA [Lachnospiraceae bacterium]|nr:multidrug export protein MepA [Lachnospiraceae bacterium]
MMNSERKTTPLQINQITEGVIWKQLLIFFFPIAVGTLFQQLYNTVDAIIVGRCVGKQALASVGGSAAVLSNFVIGFFTGLSAGATVIISQHFGAKNIKQLSRGLHTAYAFSVTVSIAISVMGWLAAPALLRLLKTPSDVMPDSILYLRIYFLGIVFTLVYNMGSSIMRAIGDSRRPLLFLIICCALNIILDLFFVVGLGMGIEGAAIATVLSQAISSLLVTQALMKSYGILRLELKSIRFHADMLKSELRIGLPGGLQSFGYSISNIIIQAVINDFGTDTAAAWAAFGKMDAIFWTVCGSFGIAITTFSGQNYGARKYDRVKKSVRISLGMSLGVCGSLILFLMAFCRPLYVVFTADQNVIDIGVYMLRLITPSYIIFIFVEIFSGALRGIGDVLIPSAITLGGVLLVRLTWILLITPRTGKLSTLMYSYPLAWGATALLLVPYYFYRRKKLLT